jgi:hypothetical protein
VLISSPVDLLDVSQETWSWHLVVQEPYCFLSVTRHEETLHTLGVQGVKAMIHLGAFFLPHVAPVSQQNF